MRAQPSSADDAGAHDPERVQRLLDEAAERRFYGDFEGALALCVEAGSRDGLRDLAHHADEAQAYDVCLEALRVAEDVRGLLGVGQYLSAYSRLRAEPFFAAAREIRRARRAHTR